jgi:hypothetical protein
MWARRRPCPASSATARIPAWSASTSNASSRTPEQ